MSPRSTKKKSAKKKRSGRSRGSKALFAVLGALIVLALLAAEYFNYFSAPAVEKYLTAPLLAKFNGSEQACGKFSAWDAAPIGKDQMVLSDPLNGRILFFDKSGKYLKSFGKKGDGKDDLKEPSAIVSDDTGHIYFIDAWKASIIGVDEKGKQTLTAVLGQGFYGPRGLAWDGKDFYVADTGSHRLARVSPRGEMVGVWGGKMGSGKDELNDPRSVAIYKGLVYVADAENNRVQIFDPAGKGQFVGNFRVGNKPSSLAFDASGRLYVSSLDGGFVKVFSTDGKFLGRLKDEKGSNEPFQGASGMCFLPDGTLVLASGEIVYQCRVP